MKKSKGQLFHGNSPQYRQFHQILGQILGQIFGSFSDMENRPNSPLNTLCIFTINSYLLTIYLCCDSVLSFTVLIWKDHA